MDWPAILLSIRLAAIGDDDKATGFHNGLRRLKFGRHAAGGEIAAFADRQSHQAKKPENLNPNTSATPARCPIAARRPIVR